MEEQLSPEKLLKMSKNIKPKDLKGKALRSLGGREGDRGEQIQEEHAPISKDQLEQFKKYKEQYKDMLKK